MTSRGIAGNMPIRWDDDALGNEPNRYMTISDGLNGVLSLDLAQSGLDELAAACGMLLAETLPPGACLMRVWVGDDTYLLRRVKHAPTSIGIIRLGDRAQEVSLTEDVLRIVITLIEETCHLRIPSAGQAIHRSDD